MFQVVIFSFFSRGREWFFCFTLLCTEERSLRDVVLTWRGCNVPDVSLFTVRSLGEGCSLCVISPSKRLGRNIPVVYTSLNRGGGGHFCFLTSRRGAVSLLFPFLTVSVQITSHNHDTLAFRLGTRFDFPFFVLVKSSYFETFVMMMIWNKRFWVITPLKPMMLYKIRQFSLIEM